MNSDRLSDWLGYINSKRPNEKEFGLEFQSALLNNASSHVASENLVLENQHLKITPKGQFLSDGIASDLFIL